MKKITSYLIIILIVVFSGCEKNEDKMDITKSPADHDEFVYQTEKFADLASPGCFLKVVVTNLILAFLKWKSTCQRTHFLSSQFARLVKR